MTAAPPPAPPAKPEEEKETDEKEPEDKDGFRLRFGLSLNGGLIKAPTGNGPTFALSGRLGGQINDQFALYYQNMPMVTLTPETTEQSAGFKAGFIDYNTLLAGVTLLDFLDLGAGGSFDYAAVTSCSAGVSGLTPDAGCENTTEWAFGLHARGAILLGGSSGDARRRSGLAINADIHPVFLSEGTIYSLTVGLGTEWY